MVKACAVKKCVSGSKSERNKNKRLNLRQTSLFQVPKCPRTLQEWRTALSQPLTEKSFICEFHFKAEDVIREDKIKLSDGSVYRSPRIKYVLAVGAIPISRVALAEESRQIHNVQDNGLVHDGNSEEIIINETLNSDCLGNKFDISDDAEQQICDSEIKNGITPDENHVADIVEDQTSSNGLNINSDKNSDTFSLKAIQDVLKDKALPFNWSWSGIFENDSTVTLFYIDCLLNKVKFKIVITADFTITITVIETEVSVTYDHQISSVTHFWNLLRAIGKLQFCSGSGILNKKCSDKCHGILNPNEEYKRYMRVTRCFNCRNLRQKLLNSKKRKKDKCDLNKRFMTIKRALHSKSKQVRRLQKKNDELKDEIKRLRNQCAMVKEKILEDEKSNLPEAQKDVRACFQAAKAKNKKQGHYTKKDKDSAERRRSYGTKNVICEVCGKIYRSNVALRYHQRVHTGERPYKCSECPKSFRMPPFLRLHMRTHTGERPYKCPQCPKAFSRKPGLLRHELVHTGIKPHKCLQCGKFFTRSSGMKVHFNTVHLKIPTSYKSRTRRVKQASRHEMNVEVQIEEYVLEPQGKTELRKYEAEGEVYQGDVCQEVSQNGDMIVEDSEIAMYANDEEPEVLYEEVVYEIEEEETGV